MSTPAATPSPTSIAASGYPTPVLRAIENLIGGYYLNGSGYDDIAVFSVPSFVSTRGDEEEKSFADVGLEFLKRSKKDGKKKLIIDLSANGGGTVSQGYNLFKELFPHLVPYGGNRWRGHEALDIMGRLVSNVSGPVYPWDANAKNNAVLNKFHGQPFDYRAELNNDLQQFQSWPDKYGPHKFAGDNFLSITRYDLNDVTFLGPPIAGYGSRKGVVNETFYDSENMILVYDGYCASTCSIFSELMRQQGKVKTIALGGLPREGIMQAVGGVKGANDYPWRYLIYDLVQATFALATPEQRAQFNDTELGLYSELPLLRATDDSTVNFREGLREGDATQTPLPFHFEAADCRIYYTAGMTVDVTTIWKTVADSVRNSKSPCIAGNAESPSKQSIPQVVRRGLVEKVVPMQPQMLLQSVMDIYTDHKRSFKLGSSFMSPK